MIYMTYRTNLKLNRKKNMKRYLFIALSLLIATPLSYAKSDAKVNQVKNNIHYIVSPHGGNVAVSTGDDGVFVIDDQFSERSGIIEDAIKSVTDKEVQFVLNTHYHFDHTGGNEFFGKKNAIIVAHDNVRKRLSTKQFISYFKKELKPLSKAGLPVVTFKNDITFHYNGDSINIIYLPAAHTDGDSAAHFTNENVIVTGDTVFNGRYPFIDVEHGGTIKGMVAAVDTLLALADEKTIIVPGHGVLMNKKDLQAYRNTLATSSSNVAKLKKQGKTLKQTIAAKPTQAFDKVYGNDLIAPNDFVTFIYESLSR